MEISRTDLGNGGFFDAGRARSAAPSEVEMQRQLAQRLDTLGGKVEELQKTSQLLTLIQPTEYVSSEVAIDFLQRSFARDNLFIAGVTNFGALDDTQDLAHEEAPESANEDGTGVDVDEQFSDPEWLAEHPDLDDRYHQPVWQAEHPDVDDRNRQLGLDAIGMTPAKGLSR